MTWPHQNHVDLAGVCFVYFLTDPFDDNNPFYVGISKNPWYRFYEHSHDASSAAYPLMRLFRTWEIPREEILIIGKKCATRSEAFDLEYKLVISTPNLVNRPYKRGRAYT